MEGYNDFFVVVFFMDIWVTRVTKKNCHIWDERIIRNNIEEKKSIEYKLGSK